MNRKHLYVAAAVLTAFFLMFRRPLLRHSIPDLDLCSCCLQEDICLNRGEM